MSWMVQYSCTEENGELHALVILLQERTPVPIEFEAVWAPELVWTVWRRRYSFVPAGTQPRSVVTIPTELSRLREFTIQT